MKTMNKTIALLLALTLLAALLSGCGTAPASDVTSPVSSADTAPKGEDSAVPSGEDVPETEEPADRTDAEIDEMILNQFLELTHVPRPSHHEEQISAWLENWALERGFEVKRDAANNVIMEIPATPGMEDRPKVILQGHMDMVFATQDGSGLDPLTTEIQTLNDGEYLRSDGSTSLGADDGIGVALALQIAEGKIDHGPLRLLFTTNEEDGMTGTQSLDPKTVQDVKYLINIDSEDEGVVTVSSASGTYIHVTSEYEPVAPAGTLVLGLSLDGLLGGHSGIDIGKNRMNAAIALARILKGISDYGVSLELASFEAGTARNAIPSHAQAVICIGMEDSLAYDIPATAVLDQLLEEYGETDPGQSLTVTNLESVDSVLPQEFTEKFLRLLTELPDGVNTWSADVEGLVESSSNLGLVYLGSGTLSADAFVRSSVAERGEEIIDRQTGLADELGFTWERTESSGAWPYKPDNRLLDLTKASYEELFSREIEVVAVHAGLECGDYAAWNSDLDIISVGPTIHNPHTVNEELKIGTVSMVWRLLESILASV